MALAEWALPLARVQRLGAAAPPVRDISRVLPSTPALETARAGVTVAELLQRRMQLERWRGLTAAGPAADVLALRATDLHAILREHVADFASRAMSDLRESLAIRSPARGDFGLQWALPLNAATTTDQSPQVTLVVFARDVEVAVGCVVVPVHQVLALQRTLQDYASVETPSEVIHPPLQMYVVCLCDGVCGP